MTSWVIPYMIKIIRRGMGSIGGNAVVMVGMSTISMTKVWSDS